MRIRWGATRVVGHATVGAGLIADAVPPLVPSATAANEIAATNVSPDPRRVRRGNAPTPWLAYPPPAPRPTPRATLQKDRRVFVRRATQFLSARILAPNLRPSGRRRLLQGRKFGLVSGTRRPGSRTGP